MDNAAREIIRAAAFLECACSLDTRAQKYASQGPIGLKVASSIRQESDHLRDLAVAIRTKIDSSRSPQPSPAPAERE